MSELRFRTVDHPEANGRKPQLGECDYLLRFPLEDGTVLVVAMGKEGMANHRNVILSQKIDEDFEKIEPHDPS